MQNNTVISFHGRQEIKDQYLKRLQDHYNADEIIAGKYWENGKGCAIGCTVHSGNHGAYTSELGISWRLALMEDSIFEKLPNDQAKEFPLQFLKAIPVGVDTDIAFKKLIIWIISDEKDGLLTVIKDKKQKDVSRRVVNLYKESCTRKIKQSEWQVILDEIYTYTYDSTYAYAYDYYSAYDFAHDFAYAYASASSKEWQKAFDSRILLMRDKLLEFLAELK